MSKNNKRILILTFHQVQRGYSSNISEHIQRRVDYQNYAPFVYGIVESSLTTAMRSNLRRAVDEPK